MKRKEKFTLDKHRCDLESGIGSMSDTVRQTAIVGDFQPHGRLFINWHKARPIFGSCQDQLQFFRRIRFRQE